MSIASEITRLQTAKADMKTALEAKGVTVGTTKLDEYDTLIASIPAGTDISDADAAVGDVVASKTFYAGTTPRKTGTMVDRGTVSTDITTVAQEVTIASGKHSGSGVVKISATEQAKIIAANIKKDIIILGVTGTVESGGGGTDPIVRYYTSGATWTKPTGLYAIVVVCIGAGAGGGAGRRGAAGTVRRGGGGGGAGIIIKRLILASQLGDTETITVGSAGSGGTISADNTDGGNGNAGGDTTFGILCKALGGSNGKGGGITSGGEVSAPLSTANQIPPQEFYSIHPIAYYSGASANPTGGVGGGTISTVLKTTGFGYFGGSGGGGLDASNTQRNGGVGARMYNASDAQSAAILFGTAGGGGGNNGVDNWGDQLLQAYGLFATTHGYGTSGSGGGSASAANSGNGGNGGNYGGGGGGGAASTNGYSGGNGGDGADGLCIVMEIYGG
jgi:hypothetical protein